MRLSEDEALVRFDGIVRVNRDEVVGFADQPERRVLWDVEALLEAMLVAPIAADYLARLAGARSRVRDPGGAPGRRPDPGS